MKMRTTWWYCCVEENAETSVGNAQRKVAYSPNYFWFRNDAGPTALMLEIHVIQVSLLNKRDTVLLCSTVCPADEYCYELTSLEATTPSHFSTFYLQK